MGFVWSEGEVSSGLNREGGRGGREAGSFGERSVDLEWVIWKLFVKRALERVGGEL